MVGKLCIVAVVAAAIGFGVSAWAVEEIPKHRQKQIWDAAPEKPRVEPKKAHKVLVWSTPAHLYDKDPHKGYCVPYGAYAFKALGEKTKAFEPVVTEDLTAFAPDDIKQFDAIVMNNSCGPWITPSDEAMEKLKALGADKAAVEQVLRKSLLDYVSGGGGIMAIHFAIAANGQWKDFQEMFGAKFTGHPWNEEVGIKVDDPDSPLVAAWDKAGFRIADEIYQFGDPYDRAKLRVLLSIDVAKTSMGVKWINRKDNDFAQAWVKPYGKGRIFYTGFGHRTELYWNPKLLQFYLDAIQFATGDIEAPTAAR